MRKLAFGIHCNCQTACMENQGQFEIQFDAGMKVPS